MLEPLLLSFQVAALATVFAGVLGTALAGLLARARFWGRDVVDALVAAPLVLPPTVLGYYLLLTVGRQSTVGAVYERLVGEPLVFTRTAAVLAATLAALPLVVRGARVAMEEVDPRLAAAAATLGASPLRVFLTIVLPLSRGGVAAGVTLGFARALGDFGMTLMIAGNIPGSTRTGALALYDAVQSDEHGTAAGLVAVLSAVAIGALIVGARLGRRPAHGF